MTSNNSLPSSTPAMSVKSPTPTVPVSSAVIISTPASVVPAAQGKPVNRAVMEALPDSGTKGIDPKTVAVSNKVLGYILVLRSVRGTLHAVMSPKEGPGALAVFEDVEQAVVATQTIPACRTNEFFVIPVGGE